MSARPHAGASSRRRRSRSRSSSAGSSCSTSLAAGPRPRGRRQPAGRRRPVRRTRPRPTASPRSASLLARLRTTTSSSSADRSPERTLPTDATRVRARAATSLTDDDAATLLAVRRRAGGRLVIGGCAPFYLHNLRDRPPDLAAPTGRARGPRSTPRSATSHDIASRGRRIVVGARARDARSSATDDVALLTQRTASGAARSSSSPTPSPLENDYLGDGRQRRVRARARRRRRAGRSCSPKECTATARAAASPRSRAVEGRARAPRASPRSCSCGRAPAGSVRPTGPRATCRRRVPSTCTRCRSALERTHDPRAARSCPRNDGRVHASRRAPASARRNADDERSPRPRRSLGLLRRRDRRAARAGHRRRRASSRWAGWSLASAADDEEDAVNELRDRVVARSARSSSARTTSSRCCSRRTAVGGHVLLEGVPGVAKTLLANAFARAHRRRLPARAVHARHAAVRPHRHDDAARSGELAFRPGPVFTNLCSPTRSTARRRRRRPRCSKRCRSAR